MPTNYEEVHRKLRTYFSAHLRTLGRRPPPDVELDNLVNQFVEGLMAIWVIDGEEPTEKDVYGMLGIYI
jgi:hypothetical protein